MACARKLIGRAGAAVVAGDPRWFLDKFVVKMASPLLLGDAVGTLRAASSSPAAAASAATAVGGLSLVGEGQDVEPDPKRDSYSSDTPAGVEVVLEVDEVLRDVVLPGAVERLTKVTGSEHNNEYQ